MDGYTADPSLPESERIATEIVASILGSKLGVHILEPSTVKVPVTRVVLDPN